MYKKLDIQATGEKIKECARIRGFRATDIQHYMGFSSPTTVYNWYSGNRTPTVEHFLALSQLFGVSINDMCVTKENIL